MKRPTTINDMRERSSRFATQQGLKRGLSYLPAPTDVFISPYAKCGTTWMQQIVHGLRTGGSMEFAEISEVVPWLELAHDMGLDAHAPQVARPRAFKSHLGWHDIPKGGRYIVVFRDPIDAMLSLYRFLEGWWFETGSIPVSDFAAYYLDREERDTYWAHAASWWGERGRDDVLCLTFEDMKNNLSEAVRRVADFIGITDVAHIKIATRQAGFEFMKAHGAQFDDHLVRRARDPACGIPPGGVASKVNRGRVGAESALVTPEIQNAFAVRWSETMAKPFGLSSYTDLRRALSQHSDFTS
ncbi:Sulfotransferase domain protein [Roseovarius litorisediminis]|uniref:Sulfotransferase domain protein n=1 Tax=Roseovarius litorisediminis TaxID=1312363 RepID=A0A1Y5TBZ5_9RHOB|nr:sulfotransferase domain-containing protein [Roseovarius litorisediminis]SLN56945.1 Sulfotransferase domain protein [Roseovarius litorisediminis]